MAEQATQSLAADVATDRSGTHILNLLAHHGARTAAELAATFGCSRAEMDRHLAVLQRSRLAEARQQGAHVYWQIADTPAATTLVGAAPACDVDAVFRRWQRARLRPLKGARSCYGHLAGELGVMHLRVLLARGTLTDDGKQIMLTPTGRAWLARRGIALEPDPKMRGQRCLDWSERQDHLGGRLGRALLSGYLAHGWLQAGSAARSLELTAKGRSELLSWLQAGD